MNHIQFQQMRHAVQTLDTLSEKIARTERQLEGLCSSEEMHTLRQELEGAGKIVLQNLLICTIVFHTVLYLAHIICFIILRLDSFDELGPFDFKTTPSWSNKKYLANLISLETAFLVSSILFVLVVEEWIWDYGCTVTVIHITLASLVNMEFPLMAHWWTSIGIGLAGMICGGQILAYLLYKNNFIYPDLDDF